MLTEISQAQKDITHKESKKVDLIELEIRIVVTRG
jgi:hypothetical protein